MFAHPRRVRAAHLLHSEALRHMPSVALVEQAAFEALWKPSSDASSSTVNYNGSSSGSESKSGRGSEDDAASSDSSSSSFVATSGPDAYLVAMTRLAFNLGKPEFAALKRRVVQLQLQQQSIAEMVRLAAIYEDFSNLNNLTT